MKTRSRDKPENISSSKLTYYARVNGVQYPSSDLIRRLSLFCEPVLRSTGDSNFQFQLMGSGVKVRYRSKFLLLATQHQFKGYVVDDITISSSVLGKHVTSNGYYYALPDCNRLSLERDDFCFFDFSEPATQGWLRKSDFFDLNAYSVVSNGDHVFAGMGFGFAFGDQEFDVAENDLGDFAYTRLGLRNRPFGVEYRGSGIDDSASKWEVLTDPLPPPNGLSGGPIFGFVDRGALVDVVLGGITCRAGSKRVNSIKGDSVFRMIRQCLRTADI